MLLRSRSARRLLTIGTGSGSLPQHLLGLSGELPAGGYVVDVEGYNSSTDAHITAELLLRPAGAVDGGGDVQLAMLDGPPPTTGDGLHSRQWIHQTAFLARMGSAGDGLVLQVNYVSGSSIFGSIASSLKTP